MPNLRYRLNVVGPFYVEAGCCTFCGVPESIAPDLFGEGDESCFVKRQPQSKVELDQMIRAIRSAELSCIRYQGSDGAILRRLAQNGESAQCDVKVDDAIERITRDHVGLRAPTIASIRDLVVDFVAYLRKDGPSQHRICFDAVSDERYQLSVAWHTSHFHPISFQRSPYAEFDWLIVGEGIIYDWLAQANLGEARYFDAKDWAKGRSDGSDVSW